MVDVVGHHGHSAGGARADRAHGCDRHSQRWDRPSESRARDQCSVVLVRYRRADRRGPPADPMGHRTRQLTARSTDLARWELLRRGVPSTTKDVREQRHCHHHTAEHETAPDEPRQLRGELTSPELALHFPREPCDRLGEGEQDTAPSKADHGRQPDPESTHQANATRCVVAQADRSSKGLESAARRTATARPRGRAQSAPTVTTTASSHRCPPTGPRTTAR